MSTRRNLPLTVEAVVAALRSGRYRQITHRLRHGDGFDVLGVAENEAGVTWIPVDADDLEGPYVDEFGQAGAISNWENWGEWGEFLSAKPVHDTWPENPYFRVMNVLLQRQNRGATFNDLADWIEAEQQAKRVHASG